MLIVYGYLKPDKMKDEIKTGNGEMFFIRCYHIVYLLIASSIIVNFLVTIITEIHTKADNVDDGEDIISFLISKTKLKRKRNRKKSIFADRSVVYGLKPKGLSIEDLLETRKLFQKHLQYKRVEI